MPKAVFYVCFTPFCFNVPCQFSQLLNLCPVIFSLTLFGWFISISFSLWFMSFLFTSIFSGTKLGCKRRPWSILKWHDLSHSCLFVVPVPCRLQSMLQEHISPSDGECLVSGSACSVGELFTSAVHEEDCSHHTGSHSMGEVWNCHCLETQVSIKQVPGSSISVGRYFCHDMQQKRGC